MPPFSTRGKKPLSSHGKTRMFFLKKAMKKGSFAIQISGNEIKKKSIAE